ncbi:hypothetical protein BH23CHL3_BH23CHL3_02610 [soil metagenome]
MAMELPSESHLAVPSWSWLPPNTLTHRLTWAAPEVVVSYTRNATITTLIRDLRIFMFSSESLKARTHGYAKLHGYSIGHGTHHLNP